MANIELPKDAEGREIPLDVEFLYSANGESVKPYSFTFRRYDGFCWEMRLVGVQNSVYDSKSFYLTPPDSWEKLYGDIDKCVVENSICMYFSKDGTCKSCALRNESNACSPKVLGDILNRIRKLRGDDE